MSVSDVQLLHIFPGAATFSTVPAEAAEPRTRLCEIVWLEPGLFGNSIILTTEQTYRVVSEWRGEAVRPGTLGEQIVISGHRAEPGLIKLGDAVLEIMDRAVPDSGMDGGPTCELQAYQVRIVEEGLVEPGSFVYAIRD